MAPRYLIFEKLVNLLHKNNEICAAKWIILAMASGRGRMERD